jgi:hypothetical protein
MIFSIIKLIHLLLIATVAILAQVKKMSANLSDPDYNHLLIDNKTKLEFEIKNRDEILQNIMELQIRLAKLQNSLKDSDDKIDTYTSKIKNIQHVIEYKNKSIHNKLPTISDTEYKAPEYGIDYVITNGKIRLNQNIYGPVCSYNHAIALTNYFLKLYNGFQMKIMCNYNSNGCYCTKYADIFSMDFDGSSIYFTCKEHSLCYFNPIVDWKGGTANN